MALALALAPLLRGKLWLWNRPAGGLAAIAAVPPLPPLPHPPLPPLPLVAGDGTEVAAEAAAGDTASGVKLLIWLSHPAGICE